MEEEQIIHAVAEQMHVDKERSQKIISAVFHELHDRLTPKEAAHAAAQMPSGLKRMWTSYEFPGRQVRRLHKSEFTREVAQRAEIPEDEAAHALTVVFRVLQELLQSPTGQEGEAWDIFSQLPKDLKQVWISAARPQPRQS